MLVPMLHFALGLATGYIMYGYRDMLAQITMKPFQLFFAVTFIFLWLHLCEPYGAKPIVSSRTNSLLASRRCGASLQEWSHGTNIYSTSNNALELETEQTWSHSKSVRVEPSLSEAAQWHQDRRRQMIEKYGSQITALERKSSSQMIGLPLLLLVNAGLVALSILSRSLSPFQVLALSFFPGSVLSLWQLQILHDCLHGSLLDKDTGTKKIVLGLSRKQLQDKLLFWGSMPSMFGYYLYLKYGHMAHHRNVGDEKKASLEQLFSSKQKDFEDGDVLFVAHRMRLKGKAGPRMKVPFKDREVALSISKAGFGLWKGDRPIRNAAAFACSFSFERMMLLLNDFIVALTGKNFFFPNKPVEFHNECSQYCRCALLIRCVLLSVGGWKSWFFLFLSEIVWSVPPHPACAMFVTNHGSRDNEKSGGCVPSSSTYAGRWYSIFTLGTNYHCEHHDFPSIPFNKLGKLREIAPQFYRKGTSDNLLGIMKQTFAKPDFYACMNAKGTLALNGHSGG